MKQDADSVRKEHVIYGPYHHMMKIDMFGKTGLYVDGHIKIHQHVNGEGVWKESEISNTGFGGLTADEARLFSAAWPIAIEIAERWNIERAGKHGSEARVTTCETEQVTA